MNDTDTTNQRMAAYVLRLPAEFGIEDAVRGFIGQGLVSNEYRDAAVYKSCAVDMRRKIAHMRDEEGMPIVASVQQADGSRRYKQMALFSKDDYRRTWRQHDHHQKRHAQEKRHLEDRYAATWPGESLLESLGIRRRPARRRPRPRRAAPSLF